VIIEPYSELEDYLDKDDFTNLLNVLGSLTSKTSSGIVSFGEGILDRFVFKSKKKEGLGEGEESKREENEEDSEDYLVPGQRSDPNTQLIIPPPHQ